MIKCWSLTNYYKLRNRMKCLYPQMKINISLELKWKIKPLNRFNLIFIYYKSFVINSKQEKSILFCLKSYNSHWESTEYSFNNLMILYAKWVPLNSPLLLDRSRCRLSYKLNICTPFLTLYPTEISLANSEKKFKVHNYFSDKKKSTIVL